MEYKLTTQSYVKMIMHCMKYPYTTVNGLLLTKQKKGSAENEVTVIQVVDVIPLFHLGHGLSGMMEVALLQVSAYCATNNLVIGGLYQANQHFNDSAPDVFATRVCDKIHEQNGQAILLMVHNISLAKSLFEEGEAESSLYGYTMHDGRWRLQQGLVQLEDRNVAFECANELVLNKKQGLNLQDFDNHLDDISNDWSNVKLNHHIEQFIQSK